MTDEAYLNKDNFYEESATRIRDYILDSPDSRLPDDASEWENRSYQVILRGPKTKYNESGYYTTSLSIDMNTAMGAAGGVLGHYDLDWDDIDEICVRVFDDMA